jgi:sulfide:quinone oxidoreductase
VKRILILGAGTAGTIMANKLRRALAGQSWQITVVDPDPVHLYQPGLLFIPFGGYTPDDVVQPRGRSLHPEVEWVCAAAAEIEPERRQVRLAAGDALGYDILIIATGCATCPRETEGLPGPLWRTAVHDFYTLDGALALAQALERWDGGRLVVNIAEMPVKCPVAPIEFAFLADWWLTRRGLRDRTELELVTPLPGAFTRQICSTVLGYMFKDKGITLTPDFALAGVDNGRRELTDWGGQARPFDLLVTVPVNMGSELIARSGLGDDLNFVPTDPQTLQSKASPEIFVIGDATDLPSSKAGSVAHFQADILTENILSFIAGREVAARFDGHANCFIESGHGKAVLVDFNYDTEPLPGKFPVPGLGPFTLLAETRANHWGKLAFRWLYWNLLLPGHGMGVPARMSMRGKLQPEQAHAMLARQDAGAKE